MTSAAQVLRQAESLKANLLESGKSVSESGKGVLDGGKSVSEGGKGGSEAGKGVCDLWVTRQKLEDVYKRLLLMDLEYALDKKVEQDLWNHAFKNQITALQTQAKDKHNPKRAEVQANLNLFLETASGFYLQFLQLICSTFKLDLPFRRKSAAFGVMKEKTQLRAKITPPKRSSCLYICQYCLVHLGDIARYRQQGEQAQTYYRHAVNLSPQNGQPYNQLAILEVNRNNKLSSVFYYVRSLAVRHPFPVAATNLEKFYTKLIKDTSEFKGKMAQNEFVNAFLQFQALLHLAADFHRASYLCGRIVSCLPTHLVSQTFSASVLVQCVAITIFTLNHVRHVPSGGDVSAASSPKGEGGGGGIDQGGEKTWVKTPQVEVMLSTDEQKSLDIILGFTVSVLELLIEHTPAVGAKARESPTLPAVQVLLHWLCHCPDVIILPPFANSSIWGQLARLLNAVQQVEQGKSNLDLSKYDEVPLPEDMELRCFQPIEKAHSKYSFSRIPVDGFPRGVEEQVRCMRLVNQGKAIAEEFPELKLTAIQQNDPPRINFSGPLVTKSSDVFPTSHERRAKQNVAMQAIMKHGQGNQTEAGQDGNKDSSSAEQGSPKYLLGTVTSAEQGSPKYLLGTVTSEPQFMKHGGGAGTGRIQTSSTQLSPGFSRRGQSPQARDASPMQGYPSPRVVSPRPGSGRVASPLPPSQQQQQQQPSPPQAQARKQPAMTKQAQPAPQDHQMQQPQQHTLAHNLHSGSVRFQPPPSPASPPGRGHQVTPQHAYPGNAPFQGQAQSPGQTPSQGHMSQGHGQVHVPQGHGFQGQGVAVAATPGYGMDGASGQQASPGQGAVSQYLSYPVPFASVGGGDRYCMPSGVQGVGSQASARVPLEAPRMQQPFSPGQAVSSPDMSSLAQGAAPSSSARHPSPNHQLNQEMLSALRLASQISQQQAEGNVLLHPQQQQQQQQEQPVAHSMPRVPAQQRLPVMGHGGQGPAQRGGAAIGPTPSSSYPTPGHPQPFHPGMGLPQHTPADVPMHAFSTSRHHPHPHLQGAMPPRGQEMGLGQMGAGARMPALPIPMPGQQGAQGFPALMTTLFQEEGGGPRPDAMQGFHALSPLTIQPPKSSPPDTRISTSFQGHAEGTPKPDKQEVMAPEKREVETVIHGVGMPVGQPGGEYSLFASSSPWSMPLNSSSDSKSMASSPFSSQDSSMRNSPVVGFDPQAAGPYDNATRHKAPQGEGWVAQGQGYEEQKGRGQSQQAGSNMPTMWSEAPPMTPLERLLEQQRMQRQTDPH